jgi:hypothetical protein
LKQPDHNRVSNPQARNLAQTRCEKGCVSPVRATLAETKVASAARCVGADIVFELGFDFALRFGRDLGFEVDSGVVLEAGFEVVFDLTLPTLRTFVSRAGRGLDAAPATPQRRMIFPAIPAWGSEISY